MSEKSNKKTVTIVVESVNRELDNALLLKCEMERRGWDIRVMNKYEELRDTPTDVLVVPNCYNRADYEFYRYRFNCPSGRLVNLQYEQVLSPIEEDNELYSLDPVSKTITHTCWGRHTVERLTGKGVAAENLPVTGAIQLDTTRPMFGPRWKTREEIAAEFGLEPEKKWILYISTFATMADGLINEAQKKGHTEENVDAFAAATELSQAETLDWFDRFIEEQENAYTIIYRPHPVELESPRVQAMRAKHPEAFRVIQDYEVKQWLRVADIPCTWISTAIAESYFTGVNCLILRPVPVPESIDCVIYKNCRAARTFDEFKGQIGGFERSFSRNREAEDGAFAEKQIAVNASFPIDSRLIEYYYDFSPEPAFRKIADVIEDEKTRVPENDIRLADGAIIVGTSNFKAARKAYLKKSGIRAKLAVKKIYRTWYGATGIKLKNEKLRSKLFVEEWEKTVDNRINSKALIAAKEAEFRRILENG